MEERNVPGIFRHFKGNYYAALAIAKDSETKEEVVVYRALYGEGALWVRPRRMWEETVERDGKKQPRFAFLRPLDPAFVARLVSADLNGEEMRELLDALSSGKGRDKNAAGEIPFSEGAGFGGSAKHEKA